MSAGDKIAEREIAKQQKEIRRIYTQAAKEIRKKTDEFARRHSQKNAEMMAKKKAGQISEEQYQQWMKGQVFIGEQWETKMKSVARTISDANIEAARLVRTGSLRTLGENMNFALYELEKHLGITTFDLYDSRSVSRLIKDSPKLLPEWKINKKKDYKWNYDKVKDSVTQGIIQGEGIPEITKRLTENLQTTNEDRMRLFARTANTGAQNAGRVERLQEAEDEGIKVKKMWVATLDSRTRDDHQYLDGQTVDADEDFVTEDGRHIRYPGDPGADPDLVYNCRCTLAYVYEGVNRRSIRRDEDDNAIENMTYREWKEAKKNGTLQPKGRLVDD